MLKKIFLLAVFGAVFMARGQIPVAQEAYDIGQDFDKAETWQQKGADFVAAHKRNYFRFLDKDKQDAANAIRQGNVKFYGLEVYETRIWFAEDKVSRLELSLFNKGDARAPLESADLLDLLKTVREKFTPEGSRPPTPEQTNMGEGVLQKTLTWPGRTPAAAQLTWRYKKVKGGADADFVRVTLVNADGGTAAVKSALAAKKATQGKGAIKKNVTKIATAGEPYAKAEAGDVFIDNVPMVDQGQKGYCAVATSERVLRYYGQSVDEHEIGASAGSTADQGTSVKAMYETVSKIGRKYRLNTTVVLGEFNKAVGDRIETLQKDAENDNKMAKKLKKPEITREVYLHGTTFDANAAKAAMEADVLKAMKLKSPKFKNFQKTVHDQVNAGVPIFWGVTLGLFPEPDIPQAQGGHMRLIIGYNDKTKEIIYTDTWGAGHEYKRMSFDNAWAIADAIFFLKPTRE